VRFAGDSLAATGVQFAAGEDPYRLQYSLQTREGFVTSSLAIEVEGGEGPHSLRLTEADLGDSLDCDLGLSPLTNLMPIRRDDLHVREGSSEITVAWISVPDLEVHTARQLYTHVRPGLVRFRSLDGEFEGFEADLEVDDAGLITHYPDLARRTSDLGLGA